MTSKRHKLEAELARHRSEYNDEKIQDAIENLQRKHSIDDLSTLIQQEAKLNEYFMEHPMIRENINDAKNNLTELKSTLTSLANIENKDSLFNISMEVQYMLVKISYAEGKTTECLQKLSKLSMTAESNQPNFCYLMKYIAEMYSLKGLCYGNKKDDEKQTQLDCFLNSIKSSIKYIENLEALRTGQGGFAQDFLQKIFSDLMKVAFQQAPLIYIKNNEMWKAITEQRTILKHLKKGLFFSVQQQTASDLAALLLRGVCKATYQKCETNKKSSNKITEIQTPQNVNEESILLLQIAESMLNMDPVLDMSLEHAESHEETVRESTSLYNLMVVGYSRHYMYSLLCSSIERSLKYIFDDFDLWFQYGLALYSDKKYLDAVQVFTDCCRIDDKNPLPNYFGAKICYEELQLVDKAEKLACEALETCRNHESETSADVYPDVCLLLGMILTKKSLKETVHEKRCKLRDKATEMLKLSHELDDNNHKPLLYLAIIHSHFHVISEALKYISCAIKLSPNDLHCLHVYALILAACKQHGHAYEVLNSTIQLYPENISLHIAHCKLDLVLGQTEAALCSWRTAIELWKTLYEYKYDIVISSSGSVIDDNTLDGRSMMNLSLGNDLDLDTSSITPNSIAATSKIDQPLSECHSNVPNQTFAFHNHPLVSLKLKLWLQAIELYLSLDRRIEAGQFLQEAINKAPLSPDVLYMKGQLAEACNDEKEASSLYTHVLAINPHHTQCMHSLAQLWIRNKKYGLAEKLVRDGLQINPFSAQFWDSLGEILLACGSYEQAAECVSECNTRDIFEPLFPFILTMELKNIYM